jgi:hypothetical protein
VRFRIEGVANDAPVTLIIEAPHFRAATEAAAAQGVRVSRLTLANSVSVSLPATAPQAPLDIQPPFFPNPGSTTDDGFGGQSPDRIAMGVLSRVLGFSLTLFAICLIVLSCAGFVLNGAVGIDSLLKGLVVIALGYFAPGVVLTISCAGVSGRVGIGGVVVSDGHGAVVGVLVGTVWAGTVFALSALGEIALLVGGRGSSIDAVRAVIDTGFILILAKLLFHTIRVLTRPWPV